ncbi:MAG: hypothetical protein AAF915_29480 [Cyanobacteria bacterium P01_D01_bin.50]
MSEKCFKYLTLNIVLLTLYPIKAHTLEDKYLGESLNSLGVRGKIEIDISNVRGTNGLATLKTEYGGRANLSVYITGINTFKMLGILTYTQNGNTWDAEANCNYLRQSSEPYQGSPWSGSKVISL